MRLVWSKRFAAELRREYEAIKSDNPAAARATIERIVKSTIRLREFPQSGRAWRLEGARELVVPGIPYIVIYDLEPDRVVLQMLFHTSREFPYVH
jgi:addiction module RelE/StbE family toxin